MKNNFMVFIATLIIACSTVSKKDILREPTDPFKLYTPYFNTAREENDIYQEWTIFNPLLGVHKFAIYDKNTHDSIYSVRSGVTNMAVANNFEAHYVLPLPKEAKKMSINLIYEFFNYEKSELEMWVKFREKTHVLDFVKVKIPPTIVKDDAFIKFSNKTILLDIPENTNNCEIVIITKIGTVILNKCIIEVDGKKIENYQYDQSLPFSQQELRQLRNHKSDSLKLNPKVKLIGIGESLHGSRECVAQASKIIKERISDDEHYALFLEVPPLLGFKINEYVLGEKSILKFRHVDGYCNTQGFTELIEFIKEYNSKNIRKITVVGYESITNASLDSLFLEVASIYPGSDKIQKCIDVLFQISQKNIKNEVFYIKGLNRELIQSLLLSAIEESKQNHSFYESYIYYYLSYIVNFAYSPMTIIKRDNCRDSLMAQNVQYFMQHQLNAPKALIYGHLGHLAKKNYLREHKNMGGTPSMGFYLSHSYKEDYKVIGLFVGFGTYSGEKYKGYEIKASIGNYKVAYPIGKSLEQLCLAIDTSSFYLNNLKDLSGLNRVVYGRSLGKYFQPMQFEVMDLQKEVDVIWFIKGCTPL